MLIGGTAGVLGAALLSGEKTAHADNGDPLTLGIANTASSNTRLTMSGANAAFTVENTNTSGAAHGASFSTVAGFGCATNSTTNHGSLLRTQSPDHFGAVVQNNATTAGTGGAVRYDGNQNMGLAATTDAASTPVIRARNLATDTGQAPGMMGLSGATAEQQLAERPAADARAGGEFAGANGLVGLAVDAGRTGVAGINTHASGSAAQTARDLRRARE